MNKKYYGSRDIASPFASPRNKKYINRNWMPLVHKQFNGNFLGEANLYPTRPVSKNWNLISLCRQNMLLQFRGTGRWKFMQLAWLLVFFLSQHCLMQNNKQFVVLAIKDFFLVISNSDRDKTLLIWCIRSRKPFHESTIKKWETLEVL